MSAKTLKSLFEENSANKIVLPDFQRSLDWDENKQKSLLSSCLVDLSIGALLFLKGKCDDFPAREIGINSSNPINPKEDCLYLLDGQQRLTSLKSFFCDFFQSQGRSWDKTWDSLYSQLRIRWFVRIKPEVNCDDIFGYNNLQFEDQTKQMEPNAILPLIVSRKILKTKREFWYHPGCKLVDDKGCELTAGRLQARIIKDAASEIIIPLYSIYGGSLHKDVIKKIASERLEEIKQEIKFTQDFEQRKNMVIQLLKKVYSSIDEDAPRWTETTDFDSEYVDALADLKATWQTNVINYFDAIVNNNINVMELEKDQVARAIAIFTAINEGGQKLSTFDLIVAKAAKNKDIKSLPERIRSTSSSIMKIPESVYTGNIDWALSWMGVIESDNRIESKFQDSFLNILSAVVHTDYKKSPKTFAESLKSDYFKTQKQLELDSSQINDNAEVAMKALQRAHAFLQFRCGIISGKDIPYRLMILPIAFSLLNDDVWNNKQSVDVLEYWYWSSVFSGAYREGQNDQSFNDIKLLHKVVSNPTTAEQSDKDFLSQRFNKMFKETSYSDKNTLTRRDDTTVPTAIYDSILQYVLSTTPPDFLPEPLYQKTKLFAWNFARCINCGETINLQMQDSTTGKYVPESRCLKCTDHHIFPLGAHTKIGESSKAIRQNKNHPLNSPLNRTFISDVANGLISDKSPDTYFNVVNNSSLACHMVPPVDDTIKGYVQDNKFIEILDTRFEKLRESLVKELEGFNII